MYRYIYGTVSSVGIATEYGWTVRDRIQVGDEIFARPDLHWARPSLL